MTEEEALKICKEKIAAHELEMKLISCQMDPVENKTTFYFTADGRVDFRELVKDLASVFHNRIELRQIGVRDEAKTIGGIGICGRPYCCKQFLPDFAPVSTKMAKVQSLSLNPAKISGSCGRLMCCLRYEEDAYEELVKNVPKVGAFVETPDGYGTADVINLLRQTVKVKLDSDNGDDIRQYPAKAVATVPCGRPKDGTKPMHVLNYNPDDEIDESANEVEDAWSSPELFVGDTQGIESPDASDEQISGDQSDTADAQPAADKPRKKKFYFRGKGGKHSKGGSHAKSAGNK